jgi:hypothetical protein
VRVCSLVGALGVLARGPNWHDWLLSGAALPSLVMSQGPPLEGSCPIGTRLPFPLAICDCVPQRGLIPKFIFIHPHSSVSQVPAEGKGTLHVEVTHAIRNHDETAPPSSCEPAAGSAPVDLRRPSFFPTTTSPPRADCRSPGVACTTPPCVTSEC